MAKNNKAKIKLKPTKPSSEVAVEHSRTEIETIDDIVKNKLSDGVNSYRDLLTDTTVAGAWLNQRQTKLTKLERQVIPADPDNKADVEAAEFIKEQLGRIKFDKVLKAMHWGVFYGYAVGEIMWNVEDGKVVLDDVLVRDRGKFKFNVQKQLVFTGNDSETVLPDNKFWTFSMDCDTTDNPYGLGLAHFLFWPVLFKKANVKFWLLGNEKQATGVPHVQYDPRAGDPDAERKKALQAAIAIKNGSAISTASGTIVEILKGESGTADYHTLCKYMDEAIALVILGQVMTSQSVGGQYKAEVQDNVLDDIIKSDADLLCNSLNDTVVKWLCEWNYPNATPPKVWLLTEDQADEQKQTQAWANMAKVGYRPTLDTVQETFGGEWEATTPISPESDNEKGDNQDFAEPCIAHCDCASFAESDPNANAMVEQLADDSYPHVAGWITTIKQRLDKVETLEEFRDELDKLTDELDFDEYAQLFAEANLASRLRGMAEAVKESNDGN